MSHEHRFDEGEVVLEDGAAFFNQTCSWAPTKTMSNERIGMETFEVGPKCEENRTVRVDVDYVEAGDKRLYLDDDETILDLPEESPFVQCEMKVSEAQREGTLDDFSADQDRLTAGASKDECYVNYGGH